MQNHPVILVIELQPKLNSEPLRVSTIKVRALIGKEWDPADWNRDMQEDFDETGDIETKFWWVFTRGSGLPTLSGISLFTHYSIVLSTSVCIAWRNRNGLPEEVSLQANAEYPHDPPHHPSMLLDL